MTNGTKHSSPSNLHLALKARVVDDSETVEERVFNFTDTIGHVAHQEDFYFQVSAGQMKLRKTSKDSDIGQLITSKTLSGNSGSLNLVETQSTEIQEFKNMRNTLRLCLPELGHIKKRRRVYVKDNIRINLDDVEQLNATFLDIEIQGSNEEELLAQAEVVKRELKITDCQVIGSTYLEMYRKQRATDSGYEDSASDA
ncbi:CYTH domain-containing protein [Aphelenchoides bicaudatus]|nr:CYTH domain-containing protein [Aphelenchoides bicaudatus]